MRYVIKHFNIDTNSDEFATDACGEILIFETAQDACAYADRFLETDDTLVIVEV
jgi:hypothetical protein